jgi:2-polyprenyl-3-methyl-5-hydroxy-6-metoxy-1,4-benzoquinol methylase
MVDDPGASVRACYSTWSERYYEDFFGPKASYPPVHLDLLKGVLREAKVRSVLDVGCGPASLLRHLAEEKLDVYGFDLAPEMVAEARRVLATHGVPPERIWEGSALSLEAFRPPTAKRARRFDAAICIGVLPHIPEEADVAVIRNLRGAVRKKGLVVLEARNAFFALFTLNRYSYRFFLDELVQVERLAAHAGRDEAKVRAALASLEKQFRMDLPPVRRGKAGEPGYDEVLSRTHNPLVLKAQFATVGFTDVRLLFYHYHCLPPMFETELPQIFRRGSLQMEDPEDWRGYFMASAFMLVGRRA